MPGETQQPPLQAPPILYKYYPPTRLSIFEEPCLRFTSPAFFNDVLDSYLPTVKVDNRPLRPPRESIGIFCMASDRDDHLMWVHYAAQHTGFVIGFDTRDTVFTAQGAVLDHVRYEPVPTPSPIGVRHCFYKGKEWSHEREWRCVRVFAEGELRDVSINKASIREVVVGHAMKPYHVVEMISNLQNSSDVSLGAIYVDRVSRYSSGTI
jgi:hypothetical protein